MPPPSAAPRVRARRPLKPLLAALGACAAIVFLFLAGVAMQQTARPQQAAVASTPSRSPSVPGIGDRVRDGKFEFVVSGVDCSRASVGLEHLERTAKGRYCVVSLTVRNIAGRAQYFVGGAQKAFDARGVTYGNEEIAGIYANRDTRTFLEKIEPGERVAGKLVFDVPVRVRVTLLELHDSLLSGGTTVRLE